MSGGRCVASCPPGQYATATLCVAAAQASSGRAALIGGLCGGAAGLLLVVLALRLWRVRVRTAKAELELRAKLLESSEEGMLRALPV